MHLSRTHTWCLAVAMIPVGCTAQSLQEAVMFALTEYPSISAAKYKSEAAQADVIRAKGPHWPQLTWSGTYNDYRSSGLSNRWVQSPTLSLNLWSGGRIQSDVERSEALARASRKQQSITRDDVALLSSEGYLQWAHHQKMVMLAKENLGTHQKILSDFQKITQVDPGRRIDLNQALVRYENAKIILLKSETEMAAAAQRVSRMLTAPAPDKPTGVDFAPTIPHPNLAQALESLNDQHPVIGNLLAQRDAAQASIRYAQAQNAPTANLVHTKVTTPGLADGQYVTQLQLNLPLFDGGSTRGAVAVAQANLQALESTLKETRLILSEQLSTYWSDWLSSSTRAEMGQQQTQTARELAYGYGQQFQVGRRSLLDLLNIQSDLHTYQSNAATALHESRIAQERIMATLGQLANAYTQASATHVATPEKNPYFRQMATTPNPASLSE